MKFRMHVENDRGNWWEDFSRAEVVDLPAAEECCRRMIQNYNDTLYKGDLPRRILEVVFAEGEGKLKHDWEKTNLVTIIKGHTNYDTLRCRLCGCTARRYGLSGFKMDAKYRNKKWESCHGKDSK